MCSHTHTHTLIVVHNGPAGVKPTLENGTHRFGDSLQMCVCRLSQTPTDGQTDSHTHTHRILCQPAKKSLADIIDKERSHSAFTASSSQPTPVWHDQHTR